MSSIEHQAFQTYTNNLLFFKQKHPKLFEKLNILEIAIESGQYKEKYSLEYKDDSYFDVIDLSTNQYLYNQNSNDFAKKFVKRVNFKKSDATIETYYNNQFNKPAAKILDNQDICKSAHTATAPIIHYISSVIPKDSTMKKIYKHVFLGVGLGVHLPTVHDKIKSLSYFIVEDDLELFRLSLFVIDYTYIAKDSILFFSIQENEQDFQLNFKSFLENALAYNHDLKYSMFSNHYNSKIQFMLSIILSQNHLIYSYSKMLTKNIRILNILNKNFNFLNIPSLQQQASFKDKPVLVVAAGPSLDKNKEWLKQNHKRFIIITPLVTLKTFEKLNISPDIIVHIDEKELDLTKIQKILNSSFDLIKNSLYIFAPSVSKNIIKIFDKNNIFFIQHLSALYKKDLGGLQTPSIGEYNYALSLILGAKEIYLLGLDLALDSKTGKTHSDDHHTKRIINLDTNNTQQTNATLQKSVLKVKGNFDPFVFTTPLFNMSIFTTNTIAKAIKKDQKVYNLSNGAYFKKTIPTHAKDVDVEKYSILDKKLLHKNIHDIFKTNASNSLRIQDIQLLHDKQKKARYKKKRIRQFSSKKFKTTQEFIDKYLKLVTTLSNSSDGTIDELSKIFDLYCRYTSHYIIDLFNTIELENPKEHITNISQILIKQLYKIVDRYMYELEKILKDIETAKAVS